MSRILVNEAKERGCLQLLHAKVLHKWYENLVDATEHDLHHISHTLTYEKLEECLTACGVSSSYVVIPYGDGIAVIIFKLMDKLDAMSLSRTFNNMSEVLRIPCTVYFPGENYECDYPNTLVVMQIMTIS